MNVVGVQLDIAWEDKPANFERVTRLLGQAKPPPGSLVVLPEMFATGFSMNSKSVAEEAGGPTEHFLSGLATEFGIFLLAGVAVLGRDKQARNKALLFSPGGQLVGFYAKMRLFTLGAENQHYAAGRQVRTFRCGDCGVAPFVCYDLRFPELFRQAAADRPELFAVIANFPAKRIHHWVRLLQARAIENQAYVVGVNRVGADPFHAYSGRSLVVDPHGEILSDGGEQEGMVRATLDLGMLRDYRAGLPFLEDLKT